MTVEEVGRMLKKIKSCYQNFVLNNDVAEAWIDIFSGYENDPIIASLNKYIKSNEYCPVPASIIKIYDEAKAKLDKSVGEDINALVGILTFMLGKSDVFGEVDIYKAWINTVPEMHRMGVSRRMIANLKKYGSSHVAEDFDFAKWLTENKEVGDKY